VRLFCCKKKCIQLCDKQQHSGARVDDAEAAGWIHEVASWCNFLSPLKKEVMLEVMLKCAAFHRN
jgi:hypothetical protein